MRIASFNLESLDLPPKARVPLEVRAEILRPALQRFQADVLCLQEVNGQHVPGQGGVRSWRSTGCWPRRPYANYARVTSSKAAGRGLAEIHNLVTLFRYPTRAHEEVRHSFVAPRREGNGLSVAPTPHPISDSAF